MSGTKARVTKLERLAAERRALIGGTPTIMR